MHESTARVFIFTKNIPISLIFMNPLLHYLQLLRQTGATRSQIIIFRKTDELSYTRICQLERNRREGCLKRDLPGKGNPRVSPNTSLPHGDVLSCQGNTSSALSTSLLKGPVQIFAKHYYSIYFLAWSKPFTAEHDPKCREAQAGNQLRPLESTLQLPASTGMDQPIKAAHMLLQRKEPIDPRERQPAEFMNNHSSTALAKAQSASLVLLRKEAPIVQSMVSGIEKALTSTGTYRKSSDSTPC